MYSKHDRMTHEERSSRRKDVDELLESTPENTLFYKMLQEERQELIQSARRSLCRKLKGMGEEKRHKLAQRIGILVTVYR